MTFSTTDELIAEAKRQNKWVFCHYQRLWFSPDELAVQRRKGRFLWGPQNFEIRDPAEGIAERRKAVCDAEAALEEFKQDVIRGKRGW